MSLEGIKNSDLPAFPNEISSDINQEIKDMLFDKNQEIKDMLFDKKLSASERTRLEEMYTNIDNVPSEANKALKDFLQNAQGGADFEKFKSKILAKSIFKENLVQNNGNIPLGKMNVGYENGYVKITQGEITIGIKELPEGMHELKFGENTYIGKNYVDKFAYTSKNGENISGTITLDKKTKQLIDSNT